ncbi:MEKHLA domain-containing protein [Streptomyces phaeochromogenes]
MSFPPVRNGRSPVGPPRRGTSPVAARRRAASGTPSTAELLLSSHLALTGRPLCSPRRISLHEATHWLYTDAPFGLRAHDPAFVHANRTAQRCFDLIPTGETAKGRPLCSVGPTGDVPSETPPPFCRGERRGLGVTPYAVHPAASSSTAAAGSAV